MVLGILIAFSLLSAIYPFARAFFRFEINYNEGWNVYNAQAARSHFPLYFPQYGWTTVNYPLVSFYLIGYLTGSGGDYLWTGRVLSLVSLVASCVLVVLIVRKLTGSREAGVFASAFALGLFSTAAPQYVAMDDPQILAHPFFLAGLLLYLSAPLGNTLLGAIAFLFVLGGNIKQNLVPIPLAVAADLLVASWKKALRFLLVAGVLVAASIAVEIEVGGPFFISKLLTPHLYSAAKAFRQFLMLYEWLQIPLAIATVWSIRQLRDPRWGVISLYFFISLLIGVTLGGGSGVNINTYFDNFFAMSIVMGACLDWAWKAGIPFLREDSRARLAVPLVLYFCVIMMFGYRYSNLPGLLSQLPEREKVFKSEVSFLVAQPGPALCESLLRCYDAGKPYVYDPFNSTSLMQFNKLNSHQIVENIVEKRYGAIETGVPVSDFERPSERFPNDVLDGIQRYYTVGFRDFECVIYVPLPRGGSKPD